MTDVCVAFPALSALSEGYSVYVIVDASGTFNTAVRDAALTRMVHAGAILTSWFALQQSCNAIGVIQKVRLWPISMKRVFSSLWKPYC